MGDGGTSNIEQSHIHFDRFIQATTCKGTFKGFQELCEILGISNLDFPYFYTKLKSKLNYWKAKALFAKLDKRGSHKDYKKNTACTNIKCLVIGAGPCGLRTAIELMFLGAKVIIVEKRDTFSRNNVLHLWPYTIQDLRNLGAKKIYGKFCAGAIDHISIRQLQLVLLKIALILGTEIHLNVEFRGLLPPRGLKNPHLGWRAEIDPPSNKVAQFEFDAVIGADGRRNTLEGFRRKEFRGKLAIAVTANFINRHTRDEARVEEISGVAFIFNQKFFQDLREATGVDLENIVYYKDDTHYFVMTAKKQSLLAKGVILQDFQDTEKLLSRNNVNQDALLNYAREAADFSTNHKLPQLDFAMNHYGQPDVAMFDFTCMYASENASLVREENGKRLLVNLVGDSLLEPFWPMGTGIARGFLAAFDAAWMVRSFAQGSPPLTVLAERESIYRLLPQTTPQNISKDFNLFSIDPVTRYPKVNIHVLDPNQVRHLYITGDQKVIPTVEPAAGSRSPRMKQSDSLARSNKLLAWCQKQTQGYRNVNVVDLTTSWKSGLALCAILHRYRPDLIDFQQLNEKNVEANNQLAFDTAEREFGISPIMTGKEMASVGEPDKLSMVMYLLQFYEMLKDTTPEEYLLGFHDKSSVATSTKSPIAFFSRLGQNITRKWTPKEERDMHQRGNIKTITDKLLSRSEVNVGGLKSQRRDMQQLQVIPRKIVMLPWPVPGPLRCRQVEGEAADTQQVAEQTPVSLPVESLSDLRQRRDMQQLQVIPRKIVMLPWPVPGPLRCRQVEGEAADTQQVAEQTPVSLPVESLSDLRQVEGEAADTQQVAEQTPVSLPVESLSDLRQRCISRYTGGVSGLTEQIASKLQRHTEPKPRIDRRELQSRRKEFPSEIGGSDVCYFCGKRVYVMERLSAEGKFFHRGCFKCDYCGETLRLSTYAYNPENGKFYCKPHYRLAGREARKRPATPPAAAQEKVFAPPLPTISTDGLSSPKEQHVEGAAEPWQAKRLRGTPERIELENIRVSLEREEDLQEVPEETLAEHNLSNALLQTGQEPCSSCSSSEYEMEEDEEEGQDEEVEEVQEEEEEEKGKEGAMAPSVDGLPWGKAAEIHQMLKDRPEEDTEAESEDEQQSESSYEGEYCPWDKELQYGLWVHQLSEEEDTHVFRASSLRVRQIVSPIDPLDIKADVHWTHITGHGGVGSPAASAPEASNAPPFRSEAVRAWLESLTGEKQMSVELSPDEEEEEEEENNSSLEDDIASDAEAESHLLSYTQELEQLVRKKEEACGKVRSPDGYIPTYPVLSRSNTDPQVSSLNSLRNQPEVGKLNSIVEPYCSERREEQSPKLASSLSNLSPVRLQPLFFPELTSPCSPVRSQPAAAPAAQSPATPAICCQPLTSPEAASPITAQSPVKSQPVPTILTSTPIAEPGRDKKSSATSPVQGGEKPAAKDPVGEFWLRSSEMRKSLRVGAPERTSGSETSFTLSTTGSASPQSFTPEELFEEHPASSPPPSGAPSIPSVEEQVVPSLTPSPSAVIEPKSSFSGQRDLTSTSGLGLNGSLSNTRTAASESLNNSDTMLTPPSSPPPPPPANEEPATLRRRKARDTKKRPAEQGLAQESPGQRASSPAPGSVRKSLAESIDEIPFADDVEDTYDERTPDASLQERFNPLGQEKPARLRPVQSVKVGEAVPTAAKRRPLTEISPEAKEVAKERMKAREKSVKSQALRDAMARELRKMKEMEAVEEASARPQRAQDTGTESALLSPAGLINGHEQQEAVVDSLPCPVPVPVPALDGSHEGSAASSESSGGKTKKRASLFSPRKSKKEKKSKAENSLTEELTKPRSIWRSVFSSYRKDRKKKEEKACLGSPSNSNATNSGTKRSTDILRTAVELQLRQHLSFSEDSDLSSDDILERTSQRSRREKPYTEEELNSKLTRRVQKAARRQAKQEELKRLHRAQIIQRQLEQVEEKQRQLEERGVAVEKALRGEADYWGESSYSEILDLHLGVEALVGAPRRRPLSFCHCCAHDRGMGKKDDPRLMQEWFKLVQEKNRLVRYESELMIFARELELEDCQSRLQQELRERMAIDDNLKNSEELLEERQILNEMLEVVEQRDALVALLEEQRLREKEEDKDLEAVMLSKSYNLNWS
ncbi:F-actin-monooxygenase MICAL3-like isoform X2 [Hemitrygon akajei]|uniref:F-actin-monooxygenase MICAL3-like isoform X2 n=1 Tax=Hemitrygon akajei TaxID=2704970 RepID=UPI003BFA0E47